MMEVAKFSSVANPRNHGMQPHHRHGPAAVFGCPIYIYNKHTTTHQPLAFSVSHHSKLASTVALHFFRPLGYRDWVRTFAIEVFVMGCGLMYLLCSTVCIGITLCLIFPVSSPQSIVRNNPTVEPGGGDGGAHERDRGAGGGVRVCRGPPARESNDRNQKARVRKQQPAAIPEDTARHGTARFHSQLATQQCFYYLLGGHPKSPVDPENLPVDHRVLDDGLNEPGKVVGLPQPAWKGNPRGQLGLDPGREALQEGRPEEPRGDRVDADPVYRQFPCQRECHPGDRGLRGRIGDLADLALVGGHRGGVDDDAELVVVVFVVPGVAPFPDHAPGRKTHHVEGPGGVDAQEPFEALQVVDAPRFGSAVFVAPSRRLPRRRDRLSREADPGTVHDGVDRRAEVFFRGVQGGFHLVFDRNVGGDKDRPEVFCDGGSLRSLEVAEDYPCSAPGKALGGRAAESRGGTGDQGDPWRQREGHGGAM
mmetsp:Transcript_16929/g.38886  ORF Transcript_16929/g.38886 Transcript_16929/m.38886 type:complete len:478 (+) Transcript_16929:85-1518(+)